jgi:hypothetical protein
VEPHWRKWMVCFVDEAIITWLAAAELRLVRKANSTQHIEWELEEYMAAAGKFI